MNIEDSATKPISVGPWGGQGGSRWDDGVYSTVRKVIVAHGSGIDSIEIEYDKKGSSIWSDKHGGKGGNKLDTVVLDYPNEFLTSVHGHYGTISGWAVPIVRSLTFVSNIRTYGPYGVEQGTYFSFPVSGGKIVGFHGRSGWYLDAIGIYLKPLQEKVYSKSVIQSHSIMTAGNDKMGYSVVQGQNYDVLVAVRQKDSFGNPIPSIISMQNQNQNPAGSRQSSDLGSKLKLQLLDNEKVPPKVEGVVAYGPWGGTGGSLFDDGACFTGIRKIKLSRNVCIVSMKICYDRDGESVWGSKHGGTGGFKSDMIIFDYPYEILTHITGTYGPLMYMGPNVIRSITFHTTKGKHGPFGEEQGPAFTSNIKEGKIIGFHGREGLFLDAIGVNVMEGKVKAPSHPVSNAIIHSEAPIAEIDNPQWSNKLLVAKQGPTAGAEFACGVIKEPAPCGPGPWGGDGGKAWDDGVFSGIKQIFLTRTETAVCSIQMEYDRNGQSVWSVKHGGNGGTFTHRLKLEYPNEVLNCITGYYGPITKDERPKVIKSLTFYTSRGKYGPFGEEVGTYFTSTMTEGKVVGFHGRSSYYLDAIGVHMQHWLGNQRTSRSSLFKFRN